MDILLFTYLANLTYVGIFLVIIGAAKQVYNLTTPYNNFVEITEKNNLALSFSVVGFLLANTIIYVSVLLGPSEGLLSDIINVTIYTALGMVLLVIARFINDKVLLHAFCNHGQLIDHQSLSVGIVQSAFYITSGLIIGGALTGEGSLVSALVFYTLGQGFLILFTKAYDVITRFALMDELENNNIAAATSYGLTVIAMGIILLHALAGGFDSWEASLKSFAIDAVVAFTLLPIVRFLIDKLLLTSVNIDTEIHERQNIAVALLEGGIAVAVALVILFAL